MQYRSLGRSGLLVSEIGFGASPLGNEFGNLEETTGARAVHLAMDHGINFFDVSPYYGRTLAEERLGRALLGRRDRVVLATKCGRYGLEDFDFSAKRVLESLEASLWRLQTDAVDLIQVHDVEFGDWRQIVQETLPALEKARQSGKARCVGITGYPLELLQKIAAAFPVDTILSYCHCTLLARDLDPVLAPFTQERGIGLLNASPLCMGLLTSAGPPAWHPAPADVRAAACAIVELCRERGQDVASAALQFALGNTHVATTIVGMSHPDQVLQNLGALSARIDAELLADIDAIARPVLHRTWPSGRPENDHQRPSPQR